MELIKDCNCSIHYHLGQGECRSGFFKSQVSRKPFLCKVCSYRAFFEMKKLGAEFELKVEGVLLARFYVRPLVVDQIREGQDVDEILLSRKKLVLDGIESDFRINEDGILLFGKRMCVPNSPELKRRILEEGHSSAYDMHPDGNKMY